MEEEEPLPTTPIRTLPTNDRTMLPPASQSSCHDMQRISNSMRDICNISDMANSISQVSHSRDLKQRHKPPIHPRPHSIHSEFSNKSRFSNGSIITQISDQDGFRTTRVPISDAESRDHTRTNHNPSSERGCNDNSVNHNLTQLNDNSNNFRSSVSSNYNINDIGNTSNINGASPNGNSSSTLNNLKNYSLENGTDGILIKNLINKNCGVVSNIVSKLNSQQITSPNGNTLFENKNMNSSVRKEQDEISTEL